MKDISLNNMLEKMSKGKIFEALKAFGSCNFGYIWHPETNSAVKLNFDRQ